MTAIEEFLRYLLPTNCLVEQFVVVVNGFHFSYL